MTITVYYFYYCILILLLTCPLRHSSLVISKTTDTSVECNNCNGMRSKDVVVMAATDVSSTALSNISTAAVTASTATTTTSTPNTATTTLKMQIAMFKQKLQLPNIPAMLKQAVHKVMELIRSLLPVRKTTQNTTQMDVPALPTEPQLPNVTKDAVNQSLTLQMQTWAGKNITSEEIEQIQEMRNLITSCTTCQSQWIQHVEDIELLRFLRAKHNHVSNAWKFILQHDQWRVSSFGAESSFVRDIFNNQNNSDAKNPLRKEAFWIAPTEHQCPTLVLRTQVHDGYYYNDDPRIYVAYLVHLLEEGKRLYGVGTKHELCVLLDRAGTVYKNGEPKVEKLDRSVIPALIELFRLLYSTILVSLFFSSFNTSASLIHSLLSSQQ